MSALEASIPLIKEAGWDEGSVFEVGNPYISCARAEMLRKALDARADVIVFLDYDLSWSPGDLLRLIETPGDVVAGTYRFKTEKEEYMGKHFCDAAGKPVVRSDGCIHMSCVPAGFLKITPNAVDVFMTKYPNLVYGKKWHPYVDLFNHGAFGGLWFGEDYAFCRNWNDAGGKIWLIPDLDITHHSPDFAFHGNYHKYLMRLPGGALDPAKDKA